MKITGDIWPIKITEPDPGSIKGQHEGMVTSIEKRGKLKVQIKKSELIYLLTTFDSHLSDKFMEAVRGCDYPELENDLEYSDIDVEVTNA